MEPSPSARVVLLLGAGVMLCAALGGIWEVLAEQAPGSLWYLGVLPGPIRSLRETAFNLGLGVLAVGLLSAQTGQRGIPAWLIAQLSTGVAMTLTACTYAAATGMHGVQLMDLRNDAIPLFIAKYAGLTLSCLGLAEVTRRALFTSRGTRGWGRRSTERGRDAFVHQTTNGARAPPG